VWGGCARRWQLWERPRLAHLWRHCGWWDHRGRHCRWGRRRRRLGRGTRRRTLGRWRPSRAQHQDLAYRDAEIGADVVPSRQIAKVEIVTPGDAVERVLGTYHIGFRTGAGGIGARTQQQAIQPNGANQARDAQCYRCNPDSKGTKLTEPSDWRSIRVSPLV